MCFIIFTEKTIPVIILLLAGLTLGTAIVYSAEQPEIPSWIKNNAKWWSDGSIGNSDFVKGIEYLINQEIMKIPKTQSGTSSSQEIPAWIKNNAKWWANGEIDDKTFVSGIQYLINNGIMRVESQINCQGTALCITAKVEKIVDGDTIYVQGYKIRLSLTNTPETNEVGFSEATAFTSSLCPVGSSIIVDQDDGQPFDVYDRVVGKVTCSGKILNSELLDNGHANILTQYCSKSEFSSESWAKKYGCTQTIQAEENIPPSSQSSTSVPSAQNENNCDPSYPNVCIPPPLPDLDCDEIPYRNFKVLPPDPHKFDGDKDGIGCEG